MLSSNEKALRCWDWGKNEGVDPYKVSPFARRKAWFICDVCDHSFQIKVALVSLGTWCSYCANRQLCESKACKNCFHKSFASSPHAELWSIQNTKNPRQVSLKSHEKFWFYCRNCPHNFFTEVRHVAKGKGCGYCSGILLCESESCKPCFNRSFASNDKAKFWLETNGISPRMINASSTKKFWFKCGECNHEFEMCLATISIQGSWCNYCANGVLCKNEECMTCFEKSFASHELAVHWSDKNLEKPREVFKFSAKKVWYNCPCGHTSQRQVRGIANGKGCIFCTSHKFCDDKECKACFEKSFASHPKAVFWSKENAVTPKEVFKSSSDKHWFICENGHRFKIRMYNIMSGRWCSLCKRKGEEKLYKFLVDSNYSVVRERKFDWCRNEETNRHFPFDFEIQNGYKVFIELDGEQHFKHVKRWILTPDIITKRDIFKMNMANQNGYSIIRITWEMVYKDRKNWRETLINAIETIEPCTRQFICTNNEHDVYQSELVENPQQPDPETITEDE